MARDFMASMLDELMGRDRNVDPEKRREITFQDEDMCKYFLAGFCPHELFVNTKADLGPCKKIHEEKYKEQYQKSSNFKKLGYEEEFHAFLRDLSHEMDRKIKRANERVILTNKALPSSSSGQHPEETEQRADLKQDLNKKINLLITEANELGANGESDAAEAKMRELEKLKLDKRNHLELGLDTSTSSILSIERKLEVCQVCGAYLVIGDAQQRIEDHLGGKQHSGFALVRRTLQEADEEKKRLHEQRLKLSPAVNIDAGRHGSNGGDHRHYHRRDNNNNHHHQDYNRDRRDERRGNHGSRYGRRHYSRSPSPPRRRYADDSDDDADSKRNDRHKRNRSSRDRSRSPHDRSSRRRSPLPPARKRTTEARPEDEQQRAERTTSKSSSSRSKVDKKRRSRESEGELSPSSVESGGDASSSRRGTVKEKSPVARDRRRLSREQS